jgi:phospholipid/cholesterol/gamma-HCH transport system substrate-binding protein
MRRTLARYGVHFAALLVIIIVGTAAAFGILSQQRFYLPHWVPLFGSNFVTYNVDFTSAKAVTAGQGQTVAISGVTVGEISKVSLYQGRARVQIKVRHQYADRIHTDATAMLRPKTPLEDMIIQLDPGTKKAPLLPVDGVIPSSQTIPQTELDEILSALDGNTRAYLAVLLNEGAKGLSNGGGEALSKTLRQLQPAVVYGSEIARSLKSRNDEIARTVTNLKVVADSIGDRNVALAKLIRSSATAFTAIGARSADLSKALGDAPAAYKSTTALMNSLHSLSANLGPAATKLEQPTTHLDAGLKGLTTLLATATPITKNTLRPFARDVQAPLTQLRPGADALAAAAPQTQVSTDVITSLFNGIAYQPPSGKGYSALTLLGYIGHASVTLTGLQDASGPVTRALILSNCGIQTLINSLRPTNPSARTTLDLLGLPHSSTKLTNGQTLKSLCPLSPTQ